MVSARRVVGKKGREDKDQLQDQMAVEKMSCSENICQAFHVRESSLFCSGPASRMISHEKVAHLFARNTQRARELTLPTQGLSRAPNSRPAPSTAPLGVISRCVAITVRRDWVSCLARHTRSQTSQPVER